MGNLSKHFNIQELVPKVIYSKYGLRSKWFIDPRLVTLIEFIREWFKAPVTVNNWPTGGKWQERGYRTPNGTGATYSQHKFGRALDINIAGYTCKEVYDEIMANQEAFMAAGLTTLEDVSVTVTWLHLDIRWTGLDHILIVTP